MYKIVEQYSKTNELKSKEIEELLAKNMQRKMKQSLLKKVHTETEQRTERL